MKTQTQIDKQENFYDKLLLGNQIVESGFCWRNQVILLYPMDMKAHNQVCVKNFVKKE
jgi:hypothetical protein